MTRNPHAWLLSVVVTCSGHAAAAQETAPPCADRFAGTLDISATGGLLHAGPATVAFGSLGCDGDVVVLDDVSLSTPHGAWQTERVTFEREWSLAPPVVRFREGRRDVYDQWVYLARLDAAPTTLGGQPLDPPVPQAGLTGAGLGWRAVGGAEARTGVLIPAGTDAALEFAAAGGPTSAGGTVALHDTAGESARLDIGWLDGVTSGYALADHDADWLSGHGRWTFLANYGFGDGRQAYPLRSSWVAGSQDRLEAAVSVAAEPVHLSLRYRRRRAVFVVPGAVDALDAVDGDIHLGDQLGAFRTSAQLAASRVWYDRGDSMGAAARLRVAAPVRYGRLSVEPGVQSTTSSLTVRTSEDGETIQEARFAGSADLRADLALIRGVRATFAPLAFGQVGGEAGEAAAFDVARRSLWASATPLWRLAAGWRATTRPAAGASVIWTTLFGVDADQDGSWATRVTVPARLGRVEGEVRASDWSAAPTFARLGVLAFAADERLAFEHGVTWSDGEPGRPLRAAPEPLRAAHSGAMPGTAVRQGASWRGARARTGVEVIWARGDEGTAVGGWGSAAWVRRDGALSVGGLGGVAVGATAPTVFVYLRTGPHPGGVPVSGMGATAH